MKRHTKSFKIIKSTKNKLVVDFSKSYLDILISIGGLLISGIVIVSINLVSSVLLVFCIVALPFFVVILLSAIFKKYLLKQLKISQHEVIFEYYFSIYNHTIYKPSGNIRIFVHTNNKKLELELFDTRIPLELSTDFPILLDSITKVLSLQLEESIEIEQGKDLLKYQSIKRKSNKRP